MSKASPLPPPGFDDLSADEKLEYLQWLWNRTAARPEAVPVPEWHRSVPRERLAQHDAAPDDVVSWDDARRAAEDDLEHPTE